MGTWPNEPRWTVQLHLWIDLSAKNLWHWNFNSNGAAKEWRNGPGSQWISGLLSEFKLPTDSPFDYIHHVTSCYIYCNYLYLIYIWSIFDLYLIYICILFLSIVYFMYFMCICASIPNPFMVAEQKRRGTARSLGLVSWPPRGQRPMKVSTMFLANQLVHFRPTLPIGSCVRSFGSFWSHFAQLSSIICQSCNVWNYSHKLPHTSEILDWSQFLVPLPWTAKEVSGVHLLLVHLR